MAEANKIALVTGAGSGVGRASALALAEAGWSVALVGRRKGALEETAKLGNAERFVVVPADVSQPEAVDAAFGEVKQRWGRLDLLFNNAGMGTPALPIDELSVEQWLAVVGVNLTGSFLCARAAFAAMRHQSPMGGRIINNGSISAHTPRPGSLPYTSTKHAITGMTKSLSLDGRPFDIACGQIDIGNAATPMTERMTKGVPQPNGTMMVEPRMDPKHVADMVVFMASLPLDANVQFVTVMATKMPFVGRG
ncbi:MAG: SDR family oxidoreductase [Acetobacteraceae bacterium]|nr:SDR family oxidoreductase [Acetobacteraceae bacterium]